MDGIPHPWWRELFLNKENNILFIHQLTTNVAGNYEMFLIFKTGK
jgi:hypothetical protein